MRVIVFSLIIALTAFMVRGGDLRRAKDYAMSHVPGTAEHEARARNAEEQAMARAEAQAEAYLDESAPQDAVDATDPNDPRNPFRQKGSMVILGKGSSEEGGGSKVELMMNPLVADMMNFSEDEGALWMADKKARMEAANPVVRKSMAAFAAGIFVMMLMLSKTPASGFALLVVRVGDTTAKLLIMILSLVAIAIWFGFKYNCYRELDGLFLHGPVLIIVSAAISLKVYDMNNPFWNELFFWGCWQLCTVGVVVGAQRYMA